MKVVFYDFFSKPPILIFILLPFSSSSPPLPPPLLLLLLLAGWMHQARRNNQSFKTELAIKFWVVPLSCKLWDDWSVLILLHINNCPTRCNTKRSIILRVQSTCFGCQPHPSSGVHKTVATAFGTGHIFCAATWPRWREVAAQYQRL